MNGAENPNEQSKIPGDFVPSKTLLKYTSKILQIKHQWPSADAEYVEKNWANP